MLVPRSHDVLTASTHTSYWQQPSDRTKDAASRPNPKVGSWSMSRQRPTRPGQRLSRHWTITANIAVNCWRSLSHKANCRQLYTANCTQLMMLLPNDWRHTACKCTRQQQQLPLLKWPIGTLNTAYSVTQLLSNIKTACNYKLQNCTYLPTFILMPFTRWMRLASFPSAFFLTKFLKKSYGNKCHPFYWPDVLPVTQPTMSKYWREHKELTPASGLASSFLIKH